MEPIMKKTVSQVLASKPVRRKPSSKNLPQVFWEGWREGFFEAHGRDPGPLKGVGVVKVKSLLSKLEEMADRPLAGFTMTTEFVQQFARWCTFEWTDAAFALKKEHGMKNVPDLPTVGVVVVHVPAFLGVYLNQGGKTALPSNVKKGW